MIHIFRIKRKPPSAPPDAPEFIVSREFFDRYFEKPMPTATFYDLVEEGKILRWPEVRGRYFLNASMRRLGLPVVAGLPEARPGRSLEDIARLAFTLIDPRLFPTPSWLLAEEVISAVDAGHARRLADDFEVYRQTQQELVAGPTPSDIADGASSMFSSATADGVKSPS